MVLKGSQVIDLSTDGSGRAGQLPPVVGITGMYYRKSLETIDFLISYFHLLLFGDIRFMYKILVYFRWCSTGL